MRGNTMDPILLNSETIMMIGSAMPEQPTDRQALELAVALAVASDRAALMLAARVSLRTAIPGDRPVLEATETADGWSV